MGTIHKEIGGAVEFVATIYTDEHRSYQCLGTAAYQHDTIRHSAGEYVGAIDIHTNGIESVWALLKRGLYGVWHHASRKHLHRYVNEATFRLNEGNVKVNTIDRFEAILSKSVGKRITYEEAIS